MNHFYTEFLVILTIYIYMSLKVFIGFIISRDSIIK